MRGTARTRFRVSACKPPPHRTEASAPAHDRSPQGTGSVQEILHYLIKLVQPLPFLSMHSDPALRVERLHRVRHPLADGRSAKQGVHDCCSIYVTTHYSTSTSTSTTTTTTATPTPPPPPLLQLLQQRLLLSSAAASTATATSSAPTLRCAATRDHDHCC